MIRKAILYTENGHIDITVTLNSVVIEDSGIGMKEDQVNNIFTPFYRANSATAVGHGVGLTIVKRLSDRFGWQLSIDRPLEKAPVLKFYSTLPKRAIALAIPPGL